MKNFLGMVVLVLLLSACGPAEVPPIVTISPNETAFLVPLEGATQSGQAQFMSLEYLQKNKLAAKRIELPVRKRDTGRWPGDFEWLPTMQVIKVVRTPVTRDWTDDTSKGTSQRQEGFGVESEDSIGFTIGATITTSITEEDSALFLYRYAGKQLDQVTDTNVRGFIQGRLTAEFGKLPLEKCKRDKGKIFEKVYAEAKEFFKDYGVTINYFGPNEGLIYDNEEIQKAINNAYISEMLITQSKNDKLAQDEINKKIKTMADTKLYEAQKFSQAEKAAAKMIELEISKLRAEAAKIQAEKWDGKLPTNILPSDSPMLMQIK